MRAYLYPFIMAGRAEMTNTCRERIKNNSPTRPKSTAKIIIERRGQICKYLPATMI